MNELRTDSAAPLGVRPSHRLSSASPARRGALAALVALAVLGCTSDPVPAVDGGSTGDAGTADTGSAPDAGRSTIAAIASASPDFTLLVAAATRAGLVETLADEGGSFTVFAPTDAAFAASGIDRAAIDAMPVPQLTQILTYHALAGEVRAADVTAGPATTVANLSIILGTTGGVTINGGNAVTGGANVVMADILASNGVIHVVDRVLLPPTIPQLAVYAGLDTLAGALETAGLVDALSAAGPFTVFAPTDEAFTAAGTLPTGDALTRVLRYHVVSGSVASTAVPARAPSIAANDYGDSLTLLFDTTSGVRINAAASVVVADVRATNGIVHVIDGVLLPMDVPHAATAAGLSSLVTTIGAAAPLGGGTTVLAALSAQAPYTVFAPTNDAFTAVASTTATLTPAQLRDVLLFHVLDTTAFPMPVTAARLPAAATEVATLNAANTASLDPTTTPPSIEGADIVVTDVVVTNGVVHVIDAVMIPATL